MECAFKVRMSECIQKGSEYSPCTERRVNMIKIQLSLFHLVYNFQSAPYVTQATEWCRSAHRNIMGAPTLFSQIVTKCECMLFQIPVILCFHDLDGCSHQYYGQQISL